MTPTEPTPEASQPVANTSRVVVPVAGVRVPPDLRGDRAVAFLAGAQHGVVSLAQLLATGLSRGAIRHRVSHARLHRVFRVVYAVGHATIGFEGRAMAAVLAVGEGAFVSHRSAAVLLDVLPADEASAAREAPIDVTVVGGRNFRPRDGILRHRSTQLDARDLRWRGPIPVSSGARTVLDVADGGDPRLVERLLAAVYRGRLASELDVRALLARSPRRAGTSLVARHVGAGSAFDRSVAERLLLELLRRAGLPEPRMNARAGGFEVDGLWDPEGVIVEFDSFTFHGDRMSFRRDRRKSAALQARGFDVVPVVWEDLTAHPETVVAVVSAVLAVARERRR